MTNNIKNNNLQSAKNSKNDEFYTRLEDIEEELRHYKDFFKNKVIYCNCDKFIKEKSNFFVYFSLLFKTLGIKKLITSYYNPFGKGKVCYYYGENNGNVPTEESIETIELEGDGSFYSDECIKFLKECDVVVTNPPFSLFRKFIETLVENNKFFLIIGNVNAITYKEIFPLIKENKVWLGISSFNKGMYFYVPDNYEYAPTYKFEREIDGKKVMRVSSVCWFTNIDNKKRHDKITLYKKYDSKKYPEYDNYDAINVDNIHDIPCDYDGVMGVPITFLDKYCPEQFEIVGQMATTKISEFNFGYPFIDGKKKYARILIRRND